MELDRERKMEILNKIIPNFEREVTLLSSYVDELEIYEKEEGKWYIKSKDSKEREKLILDETKNLRKPEEIIRQLYICELLLKYGYPKQNIKAEEKINFGRKKYPADIVVYSDDNINPWIVIEVKAPNEKLKSHISQFKSYMNASGAPLGAITNGKEIEFYYRLSSNKSGGLPDLPTYAEYLEVKEIDEPVQEIIEIVTKRDWTLEKLEEDSKGKVKALRHIIERLEELVLANSGVDSFNEIFKLIYAKLYDEFEAKMRPNHELKFREYRDPRVTYEEISKLFEEAKRTWSGIFDESDKIKLTPEHLSECVRELQGIQLFGADLRIVDEAFEFLVPKESKSEKGQYFTPRIIIDTVVKMLNPSRKEYIIDPACGSAGFLVHAMQYVWEKYDMNDEKIKKHYAGKYLWGIDFEEKATKISRAIMLIAGDGKTHIYKENSLEYYRWSEELKVALRKEGLVKSSDFRELNFDIVMTNPPFAGDIREKHLFNAYHQLLTKEVIKINVSDVLREKLVNLILSKEEKEFITNLIKRIKDVRKKKNWELMEEIFDEASIDFDSVISKTSTGVKIDYKKIRLLKVEIPILKEKKELVDEIYERLKLLNKEIEDFSDEENREKVYDLLEEYNITDINEEEIFVTKTKEPTDYNSVDRHLLFIQRVLDLLKPGGRLAIVLPQSIFNTSSAKFIREFILRKARILAVIGLHGNSFKPHTGTKTSLLLLRKWKEEELDEEGNPKIKDYPIFFAVSKIPFKDNSGNYIFVKDEKGNLIFDEKGNPIYQTDLFDIAEAFIKWGRERLKEGDETFDFLEDIGIKGV